MPEFRKKLTAREIDKGAITWDTAQDAEVRAIIPQSLVFDMVVDGQEIANLSVEWDKRSLFIGEVLTMAVPESEIVLTSTRERGGVVGCQIFAPQEKMVIRKRLRSKSFCSSATAREGTIKARRKISGT